MHAVWAKILDDEDIIFAYKYGLVIKCVDGIEHRASNLSKGIHTFC